MTTAETKTAPAAARGRGRRALGRLLFGGLLVPLAACSLDEALTVEERDVVTPGQLTDRSALPALLAGAQAEFQAAYIGNNAGAAAGGTSGDSQITLSGLMTDELFNIETFPTRVEVDQRTIQNTNVTMLPVYRALQLARGSADRAAAAYASLDSTNVGRAEVLGLAGFAFILFGENYCSGVPVSRQTESGELEFGDPVPTQAQFDSAIVRFDQAIQVATAAGTTGATRVNLARVGKGRALLNQGKFADAAAAVAAVPTTFSYQVFGSENSARENNGVFLLSGPVGRRYAGGPSTKTEPNGLNFIDADPRAVSIRPTATTNGFDNFNPAFYQQKYTSRSSAVVLADGVEARLIEAEAALQTGDLATFLARLNAARTQRGPATLRQLTVADIPATRDGQVTLLFTERAYNQWLTSHRLGDFRRLIRQYGRDSEAVFPSGPNYPTLGPQKGGGRYFTDVNFPIPFEEQNNPQFTDCIDRKA
ncbi:MAG: hypothetical protein AVDCRST_MAG40-1561 [uncultured Gemmatimonadaceae bacterium]|uniref:RagB/SusD domain-containing protein n=1 Tax=uncultured Gemmatimonadaceae bacterium TaxID=246130 RepID=A0A6J4L506_9BACT|nr:MAG: hypothetical protein AVDCRST_MAG40-1561 [uncultured Gemmatimonadaceae bacterium]